jgi:AcrR family transcriptional regulator
MADPRTTTAPAPAIARGARARNRRRRERAYLDAAMTIAVADGLEELTMSRLATAVDAAVGTVYTYFPSKGALIAELQREAIERLTASYHLVRDRSEVVLARWDDPADAALARLAAFGAFWIAATETLPQEASLLHGLIATSRTLVPPEERYRVAPAALALLAEAGAAVVAAGDAGAIDPQEPAGAVVTMAAALTGVLLTENLAQVDDYPFVPRRLAFALQRDLLRAWGASPEALDRVESHLAELAAAGPLAPRPPSDA